jgi:nicotinamidase-related amidase
MIEHIGALLSVARSAQVRVFYCTVAKRRDGVGNPFNTPLEIRLRARSGEPTAGPDMGDVVADLAPQPGEVVVARQHGMTGFYESGLDAYLRNCGIRTVVLTGVSVNIGILGTAIEAVNHGYTVVVPTDCVAGDPPEYAEQALRYSVRNVAFLSTRAEIEGVWSAGG